MILIFIAEIPRKPLRACVSPALFALTFLLCAAGASGESTRGASQRVPVIDVTDLYHPYQDPGDAFDLIAAYALPEIDLRAVVFDVTNEYRKPSGQLPGLPRDDQGPRDPGYIQVAQLNRIFNRNVPCACAPFSPMKSPDDKMLDAPLFEQAGIELLLRTLRESTQPVEIVSFGSARPVAVAYNRDPQLFTAKVRRVHLSAGSADSGFLEWNVVLDPKSIVTVLRSDLPVAIYPCGSRDGGFAYSSGNTFWRLPDLSFLQHMAPPLRRYAAFSFQRMQRPDFLRAMEDNGAAELTSDTLHRNHNVWETAVWLEVAHRKLVRHTNGRAEIVRADQVTSSDTVLPSELRKCSVEVRENGEYILSQNGNQQSKKWMYYRGDAKLNEAALQEAFPSWYQSIQPDTGSSYWNCEHAK
ncbi:MAG: hypothetical protein ACR2IE_14815 [Candidatus Sumerlaeaceae bacterium]